MILRTLSIKGTGITCKGNIEKDFEKLPLDLFNYLELGLISHTDFTVFVKLTQFYNIDYGYAYPNIPQLMLYTHIKSKATIHTSLDSLVAAGLLQKGKTAKGNNIYRTLKPLCKEELYKAVPGQVQILKERENKLLKANTADKIRWENMRQENA